MPDAPRLVAALCLAALGGVVSWQVMGLLPERADFGWFVPLNMGIGALCGWIVMGPRRGHGLTHAINNGITGVAALVFWGLAVQGTFEMVRLAMRKRYDGPFDALGGAVELAISYAALLLDPAILLTLLAGALLSGLATAYAGRTPR